MNNTDRHPECHMRTALGNCDPIGGFCTSVNEPICEALHKVSRPPTATDIVKALREAEYSGYMKAVAERPQGKWIIRFPYEDTGKTRTCSNCNITQTVNVYDGVIRFKFCPYCGAIMRGTNDEVLQQL